MDPVFDDVYVDALLTLLHLFLLLTTQVFLLSLFLKGLQLLDLLRDKLVRLLQVSFELEHGLIFVLYGPLDLLHILARILFVRRESLLTVLLRLLSFISLLFHLSKLHLHSLETRLLLK